jgi:hypothetical protein
MSTFQDYQGILGLLGGVIGLAVAVATYFRGVIQQNAKIHAIELEMNTIETRFNVFWAVIEKELPKVLIKPHYLDIDELLSKMQKEELTTEDKKRMTERMEQALNEGVSQKDSGLALGYALLIARFKSELAVPLKKEEGKKKKDRGLSPW